MNCISRKLQLILVSTLFALPLPLFAAAGKVVIAAGDVFAVNAQDERRQLQRRSDIFEGDTLVTGEDGRLQLRFEDNAILALRANSQLRISEYHGATDDQNERVLMDLLGGGFRTISGSFGKSDRDAYQVRTPNASIGIRGTHYEAVLESETLSVGVYDGGIVLTNDQGSLNLGLDSEFVFAQVQAGNLPQGLLNPPANLNVPNTPEEQSEEEEESDESADEGESNNDGSSEESTVEDGSTDSDNNDPDVATNSNETDINNSGTLGPNSSNNNLALATTDSDFSGIDSNDFNTNAIEEAIDEELAEQSTNPADVPEFETPVEPELGTVDLSNEELTSLIESNSVGVLVLAPSETDNNGNPMSETGPILVYTSMLSDGRVDSPFYIAYTDQSLNDDLSDLPNWVLRPDTNLFLEDFGEGSFGWEYWNADSQDSTAEIDAGDNSGFGSGTVNQPYFFFEAEPIATAPLTGVGNFILTGLVSNQDSAYSDGIITADFGTGSFIGSLNFGDYSESQTWFLDFAGQIEGTTLHADLLDSSTLNTLNDQQSYDDYTLEGEITGVLTGNESEMGIAGGFTAESTGSDHEAYGVFVMEENPQGGQGDDPPIDPPPQ